MEIVDIYTLNVRFVLDQDVECSFYSASSLKQQSASRHVAPLWHIILIPSSFSLILRALRRSNKYQFYSLWCVIRENIHLLHIPKTNRANKKGLMLRRQWMAAYPWIHDILSCFLYYNALTNWLNARNSLWVHLHRLHMHELLKKSLMLTILQCNTEYKNVFLHTPGVKFYQNWSVHKAKWRLIFTFWTGSLHMMSYCKCAKVVNTISLILICAIARPLIYDLQIEKFLELRTNQEQTGVSPLVQSKGTKTIYIHSIRIIEFWFSGVN
jgi:hypothetical protein